MFLDEDCPRPRRGTQEAKGEVCKTSIRRFESDPRLSFFLQAALKESAPSFEGKFFEWSIGLSGTARIYLT